MLVVSLVGLLCQLAVGLAMFPEPSQNFSREVILEADVYRLLWQASASDITIEIQVNTSGWCGFGLSPNGDMKHSDVVVGWVDASSQAVFYDMHTSGSNIRPSVDLSQDWRLVEASEIDGFTVISFTRDLTSCDNTDRNIEFGDNWVIYSYNDGAKPDSIEEFTRHTFRGRKQVNFMEKDELPNLPANYTTFTVGPDNLSIPAQDTYYHCSLLTYNWTEKHHIIEFGVDVEPGNEHFVHHIVVYGCNGVDSSEVTPGGAACYGAQMSQYIEKCPFLQYAWAIGGKRFRLDESLGMPVGGPGSENAVYMLEIHYDNPDLDTGLVDSSKLTLKLTTDLRETEVGSYTLVTATESLGVPPGQETFMSTITCPHECLDKALSAAGVSSVQVFAVTQHAHLTSRAIRTRHFRNGVELPLILDEPNYDVDSQQMRILPQGPVEILPGDEIVTECTFNSKDRNYFTFGGLGTFDEMCMTYLMVYPAIDIFCNMWISTSNIGEFAGVELGWDGKVQSGESAGVSFTQVLEEMDWNDQETVMGYQDIQREHTINGFCSYAGNQTEFMRPARVFKIPTYVKDQATCEDIPDNAGVAVTLTLSLALMSLLGSLAL